MISNRHAGREPPLGAGLGRATQDTSCSVRTPELAEASSSTALARRRASRRDGLPDEGRRPLSQRSAERARHSSHTDAHDPTIPTMAYTPYIHGAAHGGSVPWPGNSSRFAVANAE